MVEHRYADFNVMNVAAFKVKYKDFFRMQSLYFFMHEWLCDMEYAAWSDPEFKEILYYQRESPRTGTELYIWWRCEKIPAKNRYYRYDMDVNFFVRHMRDAEMVHENKKYKINWGDCNVWVTSKLVLDYNKEWKNHWLLNHVDELFHKRIFKEELDEHRIELYRDTYRFIDAIKKFFKLKTWLPEEELQRFYPEKGIGEGV